MHHKKRRTEHRRPASCLSAAARVSEHRKRSGTASVVRRCRCVLRPRSCAPGRQLTASASGLPPAAAGANRCAPCLPTRRRRQHRSWGPRYCWDHGNGSPATDQSRTPCTGRLPARSTGDLMKQFSRWRGTTSHRRLRIPERQVHFGELEKLLLSRGTREPLQRDSDHTPRS